MRLIAAILVLLLTSFPIGTYHHVSAQHLKRYLAEFDFRYNEREALGVSDAMRADSLVRGIVGKRLMYRDSPVLAAANEQ